MFALLPTLLLSAGVIETTPAPVTFDHNGISYRAVDFQRGANRIIRGKSSDGKKFRFVVRGEQVTGTFDDTPVEFPLTDAR